MVASITKYDCRSTPPLPVRVDVGGHGVIILGYKLDDTVPGGGYFVVRNSWGTTFADDGHVKITFDFAKKHGIDAYRVTLQETDIKPVLRERRTD